jgi:hypothetical protein
MMYRKKYLMALMVLFTVQTFAAAERHDNRFPVKVDVIQQTKKGEWTSRQAMVNGYSDGRILVCEEFKDKPEALCLVLITDGGEVLMVPTRLLEEKV